MGQDRDGIGCDEMGSDRMRWDKTEWGGVEWVGYPPFSPHPTALIPFVACPACASSVSTVPSLSVCATDQRPAPQPSFCSGRQAVLANFPSAGISHNLGAHAQYRMHGAQYFSSQEVAAPVCFANISLVDMGFGD